MPKSDRSFRLTAQLVATHGGGPVVCLAASAIGHVFRLHARRPGAELNERLTADGIGVALVAPVEASPVVMRVDIRGVLEQHAGYHEICGGWSDGHDAIAERLCAAFAEGDVLLVIDSPGGAAAGLPENVRRALEAKTKYGRRCTVHTEAMIGSAAMWWAASIGDEIFCSADGQVGSIGARGGHESVAGMLAIEGIAVEYFAWPDEGKIAFAPELPLSETGRARGTRDVSLAGEAFASAIVSSPIGLRYGLTRDDIVALHADMLTGQAAVNAHLADGVSSLEDVMGYSLAMAGQGNAPSTGVEGAAMAMNRRAEAESKKKPDDGDGDEEDEEAKGTEPDAACKSCGSANEANSKFCDQCGANMAAPKLEGEAEEAESEEAEAEAEAGDEPPPAAPGKPAPVPGKAPPPAPGKAPPAARTGANVAELLGLRADASMPAVRTALIGKLRIVDHAAQLTGARTDGEVLGGLDAIAADASAAGTLRSTLKATQRKANAAERMSLLRKLAAANIHPRGELLVDAIDENGKRTGVHPAPLWGAGPTGRTLANLRGYTASKLANGGGATPRNPFQPDEAAAEGLQSEARVKRDAGSKEIQKMSERSSSTPERLAAVRNALMTQMGTSQ